MSLDIDRVLVPVDGSDEAREATEYAVAVAAEYDAAVHAVYVLGEQVVRAIETGSVDAAEVADDSEAVAEEARAYAADHGVDLTNSIAYGFSTRSKLRHPGSVVLDTAEDVAADFLVVPREPVSGDPGEVLEKAAEYVLLYASQPVLSV
jgi:nucleotide-binding universal stress UspA family protein